jgi:hypothetical protein
MRSRYALPRAGVSEAVSSIDAELPMRPNLAILAFLLLGLWGCVAPALPTDARPDLDRRWIDVSGKYRWPQNDGFANQAMLVALPPGVLIDRFGPPTGRFFSPKGAAFKARALPTVCERQQYTTYRVVEPLLAWAGKATAWFGEPGGATQLQTDAPAASLVADGIIEPLPRRDPPPCN